MNPKNWRKYLPTVREEGEYTGPFSIYAEYHALGVGFIAVLIQPALLVPVVAYGLGSGTERKFQTEHFKDAGKELAYTGLGAGLALVARGLGFTPEIGGLL